MMTRKNYDRVGVSACNIIIKSDSSDFTMLNIRFHKISATATFLYDVKIASQVSFFSL